MARRKITMPNSPNFVSSNFQLIRVVGSGASIYTGKDYTQDFGGAYWSFSGALPPMTRTQARNWQSFLLDCEGPKNVFEFADPDALTNQGTFDGSSDVLTEKRVDAGSVTLSATRSTSRITCTTSIFTNAVNGDYIHIAGFTNNDNNGTFKITNKVSATVVEVSAYLTDESSVSSCSVKQNVQGANALSLRASGNAGNGTILKGDYLGIRASDISNANLVLDPVQYVMVTENATETDNGNSDKNHFSVKVMPPLRQDLADSNAVKFISPKGLFRLATPVVEWDADNVSRYGVSITAIEVV